MAVKSRLNEEVLAKLGVTKLAELVLSEAQHAPAFRRRVTAALAAIKGPDAVAAIIDRRLAALERARGFIEWEHAKTFANDLRATVTTITEELGKTDPDAAIDRLMRFLGAAETVFERIDDSSGRIQDIFHIAADAIPGLAAGLPGKRKATLLDRLHHRLVDDDYGLCSELLKELLPLLPAVSIETWDSRLVDEVRSLSAIKGAKEDWRRGAKLDRLIRLRQSIADSRGDSDAFIALEHSRAKRQLNTLAIAERLLRAGRHAEALEWGRKPDGFGMKNLTWRDIHAGADPSGFETPERISLELLILEEKGEKEEAQALRWKTYLESLDVNLLREYVARLADFEEFDVLDRAFDYAAAYMDKHRALKLFMSWPKLDLASRMVLGNRDAWDGRQYDLLLPAAEALEQNYPAAATILYRTLLDFILDQSRSQAYGHAARYLASLDRLGNQISETGNLVSHAAYEAELRKKHGRKSAFWARVE